jgi:signal transduction histidine kinase
MCVWGFALSFEPAPLNHAAGVYALSPFAFLLQSFTMGIRAKLFLIFFACGIVPLLLLGIFNYWTSVRNVEALLRNDVDQDAKGIADDVQAALFERESGMIELASTPALREYVGGPARARTTMPADKESHHGPETPASAGPQMTTSVMNAAVDSSADRDVPEGVRAYLAAFFESNRKYYAAITCLDVKGEPLLRLGEGLNGKGGYQPLFETKNFLPGSFSPDARVWSVSEPAPMRAKAALGPMGMLVRYTVPVFTVEEGTPTRRGALLLDFKLESIFKEAARGRAARWSNITLTKETGLSPHLIVALNRDGQIVYHSNEMLNRQSVLSVMPSFKVIGEAMMAGQSGSQYYDSADGDHWLAVYHPIEPLDISVAAASDESAALRGLRNAGLTSLLLSALIGIVAAVLLAQFTSRTARSIERVTEGAVAIAGGKLDQRIEVRSSDETSLLAETFNQMTDRLREQSERLHEQMVRETETQQFQAFMRISAMLTHDLKNSISALSLLVNNMERQFDKEEFRRDAMQSLREATDKLRALVAKLSNPVETLSGEYKRPRPYDLIPIIKRVLAATAEPVRSLHEIETSLPETLVASVDAERIEKVVENLVLNAIEAMGTKKGLLKIEAGQATSDEVFFSITDTGPGMSEEFQRTRLFRPFKTTKSKGVGLGLYTCREVVKAHGGHIDVESQKGVGTCFRVVLPSVPKIVGPGEKSGRETPRPVL